MSNLDPELQKIVNRTVKDLLAAFYKNGKPVITNE